MIVSCSTSRTINQSLVHLLGNNMDVSQKSAFFWPSLTSLKGEKGHLFETYPCMHVYPCMGFPKSLLVILLVFLTDGKSSLPQGVTMPRAVDPRFTGTQELQTIARKHTSFSHCDDSTKWMQSLRPANASVSPCLGKLSQSQTTNIAF